MRTLAFQVWTALRDRGVSTAREIAAVIGADHPRVQFELTYLRRGGFASIDSARQYANGHRVEGHWTALGRPEAPKVRVEVVRNVGEAAAPVRGPQQRPVRRADCVDGPRPCMWIECRYHLYPEVKQQHPGVYPQQLVESCILDVIDARGAISAEAVGEVLGITKQRALQIEVAALSAIGPAMARLDSDAVQRPRVRLRVVR